jgi:cytochrome P450
MFMDGDAHKNRKALLLTLVTEAAMNDYLPIIDEEMQNMLFEWSKKEEVTIFPHCLPFVTAIVFRIFGGLDKVRVVAEQKNLQRLMVDLVEGMDTGGSFNLPFTAYSKAAKSAHEITRIFKKQIKHFRNKLLENKDAKLPPSFASILARAALGEKKGSELIGDLAKELNHIALAFVGFRLTTNLLLELSRHAEVMQKVKAELKSKLGVDPTTGATVPTPTVAQLNSLQYTDQVIKETLRLYPTVPAIIGFSHKEFQIEGINVPKNTQIIGCPYSTNHDSRVYKSPDTFDPERFSPSRMEDLRAKCPHFANIPLGGGKPMESHRCVGESFMKWHMKLFLIRLLGKYECKLYNHQNFELDWKIFNPLPTDRVRMRLIPINTSTATTDSTEELARYEIAIESGSSTVSDIYITLVGSKCSSPLLELHNKNFEKGTTAKFVVEVPNDLGVLKFIQVLKNDQKGLTPSWFVTKVFVRKIDKWYVHGKKEEQWTFPCHREIGKEREQFVAVAATLEVNPLDV